MRVGARTRAFAMVAAGAALVIGPFVVPSSAQQEELIGYLGVGDSDGFAQTGGQQAQQGYPQVQTKTAHTFSSLETGENGRALASSQWPGEFAGNLGSLFQVFGAPEEAGALNYPVRAEASTAGPAEASQPGMYARVDGPLAEATASSEGYDGDGSDFLTYGDVATVSRSELVDGTVVVTATAVVTDIDIGGVITIDSVKTTAIARTDGKVGSSEGSAVVSGVEIGGQPARVDENGVRAGDGTNENPANAIAQTVIDDVLSNFAQAFQVEMYVSKPLHTDDGAIQEYRSGSLIVKLGLGDPQGDGGDGVIAIGGSNAYAQATSGIPFTATPLPPVTAAPFGQPPATSPTVTDSGFSSTPDFTGSTDTPTGPPVDAPDEIATGPVLEATPIVDRFSGLGFVMPFIVLLGGLIGGRGLQRFHAAVTETSTAACLIDGEAP